MKKNLALSLLLAAPFSQKTAAQKTTCDSIFFRDGSIVLAEVKKAGDHEILWLDCNSASGEKHLSKAESVLKIRFKNGGKKMFGPTAMPASGTVSETLDVSETPAPGFDFPTRKGKWAFSLHNFSPSLISDEGALGMPATTNALGISVLKLKGKVDGKISDDVPDWTFTSAGFQFSGQKFLTNGFSIGLNAGVFFQKLKEREDVGDDDVQTQTTFVFGPEIRYFIPIGPKSMVWLKGNAGFGNSVYKENGKKEEEVPKTRQFSGSGGLAFFPISNFSLDLGVGYQVYKWVNEFGNVKYETILSGLLLDLGGTFYF